MCQFVQHGGWPTLSLKCQYFSWLTASPPFKGQVAAGVHLWFLMEVAEEGRMNWTHTHTHTGLLVSTYLWSTCCAGDESHERFLMALTEVHPTWWSLGWFLNQSGPQTSGFEIFIIKIAQETSKLRSTLLKETSWPSQGHCFKSGGTILFSPACLSFLPSLKTILVSVLTSRFFIRNLLLLLQSLCV